LLNRDVPSAIFNIINPARTKEAILFIEKTMKGYNPDPDRPFRYEILEERIDKFYASDKKVVAILAVFTVIALFTAYLGLLGLTILSIEQSLLQSLM